MVSIVLYASTHYSYSSLQLFILVGLCLLDHASFQLLPSFLTRVVSYF